MRAATEAEPRRSEPPLAPLRWALPLPLARQVPPSLMISRRSAPRAAGPFPPSRHRLPSLLALAAALAAAGSPAQEPARTPGAQRPPEPAPQDPPVPPPPGVPAAPAQDEPVVVTASRRREDPLQSPYQVHVVDAGLIRERGYRTTPQALRDIPGVLVQETSPGQGSPFLRGFTGFQNLMLIDGVRLNNSVFRSGPNQYWNTVDVLSLDRLEVVMGPSAAQYGSDAIGGVVQAFTRNPWTMADRGLAVGGSTYMRMSSAEDSVWGRAEVSVGQTWADGTATGFLVGGDVKSFGDIEGGDSVGTQENTGYRETALDFKVEHWLDRRSKLVFLQQYVAQDDVPRTHSTAEGISWYGTSVGSDVRRDLDQERRLTYLQYHATDLGGAAVDGLHLNLSWHQQEELEDRIRSNGEQRLEGFDVGTLGAWLQAESGRTDLGQWTWGVEWYHDEVDSFARNLTTPDPADAIQGPVADDASYDLLGIFVQDAIELGDSAELFLGARYTYASADADSVRDPATNTRIALHDQWDQFTGNARLRVDLDESWNVFAGVSQGFRAPNLSDLTSFGVARSGEAEVPSPGLSPEHYTGYEIGTKVRTERLSVQASWFYTDIEDQILRFPTGTTNPSGDPIVTKANVGDGYIQGVELQAGVRVRDDTSVFGAFAWQYGRVSNFEAGGATRMEDYPSRLLPLTAMVGARWEPEESDVFVETRVVRAEDADKLSAGDQRDTQRIPPGGTPSYTVWHASVGWQIADDATLDMGVDNITDADCRVHGSGSNSPGRNLIVGMRVTF